MFNPTKILVVFVSLAITVVAFFFLPFSASAIYFLKCDPNEYPDFNTKNCYRISRGDSAEKYGVVIEGEPECPQTSATKELPIKGGLKKGRVQTFFAKVVYWINYNPFK